MKDLAVFVPVLNRPHQIEPMLTSLRDTCPKAHVYFATTKQHTQVRLEIARLGETYYDVPLREKGDMARKINHLYSITKEPYMFMAAGDVKFHKGWHEAILNKLEPGIHCVGTNDLGNEAVLAGLHSTHSFVTREYVDKHGTIDEKRKVLCEVYPHEYCDNEFVQTAIARGMWAMAMDSIVEHMHPDHGKEKVDESYASAAQAERLRVGWWYYKKRRKLWEPQEPTHSRPRRR